MNNNSNCIRIHGAICRFFKNFNEIYDIAFKGTRAIQYFSNDYIGGK